LGGLTGGCLGELFSNLSRLRRVTLFDLGQFTNRHAYSLAMARLGTFVVNPLFRVAIASAKRLLQVCKLAN
jgi:hypothetical protein